MLERLHRIGSGCGLEIRGDALVATAVKSRSGGVTWLGSKRIEGFRERPATEWGRELSEFLSAGGVAHVALSFVLPRQDVIVRSLQLPPMSAKERQAAVRYQLDGLHPFGEDEVYFTFAPLGGETKGSTPVAVAIAEKTVVDRYADLFEEAGLALAAFTVSSSTLYAALRVRPREKSQPLLVALRDGTDLEVYGESAGRPLLSLDFNLRSVPADRALQLALSDLRLSEDETAQFVSAGDDLDATTPAGVQAHAAAEVFPTPLDAGDSFDFSRDLSGLAAALESACPRLGWRANLLPEARRKTDSRLLWAPTAALLLLLCLLGVGFLVRPWIQNGKYAAALEQQAAELEKVAATSDANREQTSAVVRKIQVLEDLRSRTRRDLKVLSELSAVVPDTAWMSQVTVTDNGVQLSGQAASAAPLLGVVNEAASLEKAAFSRSLVKADDGERFQITAARRQSASAARAPGSTQAAPASAPAQPEARQGEANSGGSQAMTTLGTEAATASPAAPEPAATAEPEQSAKPPAPATTQTPSEAPAKEEQP